MLTRWVGANDVVHVSGAAEIVVLAVSLFKTAGNTRQRPVKIGIRAAETVKIHVAEKEFSQ